MRHTRLLLALIGAAALAGCSGKASETIGVSDARVQLPAVAGRPGAAYFTLHGGAEPAQLVAVEAEGAASTELHEMAMVGKVATMRKLDSVDVPARAEVAFAPGGRHAMLFGIDPSVKPEDEMRLSFRFAKGPPISVEAKVVAAGE